MAWCWRVLPAHRARAVADLQRGRVVNLAHGAFYALGAYASLEIAPAPGVRGCGGALAGRGGLPRRALRALHPAALLRRRPILSLLATFGLALVAEQAIRMVWGAAPLPASMPVELKGSVVVGDFLFSRYRLLLLAIVAVCWRGSGCSSTRPPSAAWSERASSGPTWSRRSASGSSLPDHGGRLGVAMAALAGALFAPIALVHPAMGAEIITVAFVVVVIGGLGSFWGVVLASLLVGVVRGSPSTSRPRRRGVDVHPDVPVLLLRPRGLLGERIEKFE